MAQEKTYLSLSDIFFFAILNFCYEYGQSVPQSYEKVRRWYTKVAEQGHEKG
jgi:TPR repeat protein